MKRERREQGYYWVQLAGWPGLAFVGYWTLGMWTSFAGYSGNPPRVLKVLGWIAPPGGFSV